MRDPLEAPWQHWAGQELLPALLSAAESAKDTPAHVCADETSLPVLGAGLLWKGPPPCPLFEGL